MLVFAKNEFKFYVNIFFQILCSPRLDIILIATTDAEKFEIRQII